MKNHLCRYCSKQCELPFNRLNGTLFSCYDDDHNYLFRDNYEKSWYRLSISNEKFYLLNEFNISLYNIYLYNHSTESRIIYSSNSEITVNFFIEYVKNYTLLE